MILLLATTAWASDLSAHASVGAGVPRGVLQAGPSLTAGIGVRPDVADGRLLVALDASWLRSRGDLEVEDWRAALLHHQGRATASVGVRALEIEAPVSPFVAVGPTLGLTYTQVDQRVLESGPRVGAHASVGLEVVAGPGLVQLAVRGDALRADELLGPSFLTVLTPSLGYRL